MRCCSLSLVLCLAVGTPLLAEIWSPATSASLQGLWGDAQAKNAARLAAAPLDAPAFILDDVALRMHRKFSEYSGDISGRWIGAAAFLAPQYPQAFAALPTIVAGLPACQQADGHFGAPQALPAIDRKRDMPILWGNGRLLIGLVELHELTADASALDMARRLGDYFVTTDAVYNRAENLRSVGGSYADGFATCYFSSIEGLVALARVTKDPRYLNEARRIAELAASVTDFADLHAHGRLCAMRGFVDLYALTREPHWLEVAERDWTTFYAHHRLPTGGIKEVLNADCRRDEGCAVADWLRFNLSLARQTGKARYLDEAERCLKGHFLFQQFANGGAGHRLLHQIGGQPVAFAGLSEEAWWCCGEHWARAMAGVANAAVAAGEQGPCLNLAVDCDSTVRGPGGLWKVSVREDMGKLSATLTSPKTVAATVRIHRPAWAREGSRIELPKGLTARETADAWLVTGTWRGSQAVVVHLPVTIRAEGGSLLWGHDLLAAHPCETNRWLLDHLGGARPTVRLPADATVRDGHLSVQAALPDAPEQWRTLDLEPLRARTGQAHEVAWFDWQPQR